MGHITNPQVGDWVSFATGFDVEPATVIKRTPKTVLVRKAKVTLLNGFNSGEPDALKSYAGGFAHHVEGKQRYDIQDDPNGEVIKFTYREKMGGVWVEAGAQHARPPILWDGWQKFYDYNF